MQVVDKKITIDELKKMSEKMFGNLVKAVVDVEKEIMVVDAEFHSDEESYLLEHDSLQKNLWGILLHPAKSAENWIEFDSIINIRPSVGNKNRGIDDLRVQEKIKKIVTRLIVK